MKPSPDYVSDMLAQDAQLIDRLQGALEDEREALEQRDQQRLISLIDTKNQTMAALGEHALERQGWLEASGLSTDHRGWQQWLSQRSASPEERDQWQALAERLEHCQALNDINGKIIQRAQQTLGQVLDLLRGQNTETPSLYNAQGRSGGLGGSQTLVKA